MATYDIATIRSALKTLITTADKLAFVYDYFNPKIEGYPCVAFDMENEANEMLDDANNLRTVTFKVYIMQEISVATRTTAKDLLDAAVKQVVNILETKTNDSLSGNIDWLMPINGKRGEVESPEGNILYQEIIIDAKVASTIL